MQLDLVEEGDLSEEGLPDFSEESLSVEGLSEEGEEEGGGASVSLGDEGKPAAYTLKHVLLHCLHRILCIALRWKLHGQPAQRDLSLCLIRRH